MEITNVKESREALENVLTAWGFAVNRASDKTWYLNAMNGDKVTVTVTAHKDSIAEMHIDRISNSTPAMSAELELKGIKAAKRFLTRRGWECFEYMVADPFDIVARDEDGTVVFVTVTTSSNDMPKPAPIGRAKAEMAAARWMEAHRADFDPDDQQIRFDAICVAVLSADRALLRHNINVLGLAVA